MQGHTRPTPLQLPVPVVSAESILRNRVHISASHAHLAHTRRQAPPPAWHAKQVRTQSLQQVRAFRAHLEASQQKSESLRVPCAQTALRPQMGPPRARSVVQVRLLSRGKLAQIVMLGRIPQIQGPRPA